MKRIQKAVQKREFHKNSCTLGRLRITSVSFVEAAHRWGQHWPNEPRGGGAADVKTFSQVVTEHVVCAGEVFEVDYI